MVLLGNKSWLTQRMLLNGLPFEAVIGKSLVDNWTN